MMTEKNHRVLCVDIRSAYAMRDAMNDTRRDAMLLKIATQKRDGPSRPS